MNACVQPNERILLTSFHYWRGLPPGHACPIFAYYFVKDAEILLRPHTSSFDSLRRDIILYRLDWALLSPEPGPHEVEVFDGFIHTLKLRPYRLDRAFLFRTSDVYRRQPSSTPSPHAP
jgi:hypothetical protein